MNLNSLSFNLLDVIIDHLILKEKDPINQARIKMVAYILVSYFIFNSILFITYLLIGDTFHLIRLCILYVANIILFGLVYYKKSWKFVSHAVLCLCTLAAWTNITIYTQSINTTTLQYIWLACILSFYMHGLKWGWFYSIINIMPVLIFSLIEDKSYFLIGSGSTKINYFTYNFVVAYNFFIIIFLQYYLFKTFQRNFLNLTNAKNEVDKLNCKLKISLQEGEDLSNSRIDFLSTMSHELRTPLNGVIGISNALISKNPRKDQEKYLNVLKFSAENLLLLINDVLDFNKFGSGKIELEKTDFELSAVIKNIHQSLKFKADEKMLKFHLEIDKKLNGKFVKSDPTRLLQILSNLINNAIKFTEKGSIKLNVDLVEIAQKVIKVRFTLVDTGIGIESHRQLEIFDAYTQASPSTFRNYGGTGLGLPIVKRTLELFNSEIHLTSKLNVGTKIYFDIDFTAIENSSLLQRKPSDTKKSLNNIRILVAEDNEINILVIKKTLEQWGIIPEIAENGIIALEKVLNNNYDLILMDLYMPEMDGYSTAVSIRNIINNEKAQIPIIALTASVNEIAIQKIKESGMNDYLSKPFNPDQLYDKIYNLTKKIVN